MSLLASITCPVAVNYAALSPDGRQLVAVGDASETYLFRATPTGAAPCLPQPSTQHAKLLILYPAACFSGAHWCSSLPALAIHPACMIAGTASGCMLLSAALWCAPCAGPSHQPSMQSAGTASGCMLERRPSVRSLTAPAIPPSMQYAGPLPAALRFSGCSMHHGRLLQGAHPRGCS
jgi:hypothetical protein